MKTNIINIENHEETICNCIKSQEIKNFRTLYCDSHFLNDKIYYTVSLDEIVLACFTLEKEAVEYFDKKINKI